ncbi:MAG: response regulator [Gemmatimonadales bacterium]|nr:response regulator [Gemmatimonadales bacterium]NIN10090.1 response regulator [Gemmatimonadales bacterium]NIR02574.1 response regulator [Gemmatimonadales bacterium]NIS66268.1 response regulator [Gemmatimonadales bacterium]
MTSPTILIVDDDPAVRRVLSRAMGQIGYGVLLATTGEEACEVLAARHVDLILMDLRMPSMSGQTLFHMIRTQWPHLAARVVIMSGDPEAKDHEDWLDLHNVPVLSKPFGIPQIVDLTRRLTATERREASRQ